MADMNLSSELDDRVINTKEFMILIGVKSRTTFDKYIKEGKLPKPMEWPPGTTRRGWFLSEATEHVNCMMATAAAKRAEEVQTTHEV